MTASWDSSVNLQPAYGTTKASQPITRTARFGSGYEQVGSLGINQNPKSFTLTYNLSESESDTVEAFLDARGGTEKVHVYAAWRKQQHQSPLQGMEQNDDHKGPRSADHNL